MMELRVGKTGWRAAVRKRRILVIALPFLFAGVFSYRLAGQQESGWRISPEKINIAPGADRPLQLLDDAAQELHGARWSVDQATLADVHEEDGRAVVHAKAAGTVRITATLNGERRSREIKIWDQAPPPGTTNWGTHPIGREIADISAVPQPDGPTVFSLEQTASGNTYLRAVRDDGIQVWNWMMPEKARDVELVCGDWLGGALISANRGDSFTLYTVANDGKLRWHRTLAGSRKGHAYNLEHLIHVLSQSPDGNQTKLTGLDETTGAQKFELTLPQSHASLTNVRKLKNQMVCGRDSVTSPVRAITSQLFVNIDGFAYVAFTENEWTLAASKCIPGATLESREVSFARNEKVVLWQIHPDGTYRSTIVEESKSTRPLSEPASVASPTGDIIPDGLGGVLLSIRKAPAALAGDSAPRSTEGLVYRLNAEGDVVYKLLLPRPEGKLHDAMVLGQENVLAFATRGNTLIAFNVQDGKETWRWNSPREIEVFVALANGGCLVQTPTAVVQVDDAMTAREVFQGQAMIDWQGHLYRKHN